MNYMDFGVEKTFKGLFALVLLGVSQPGLACGGFFCDNVPINQAAEQIVFRQQGGETTAMIKIDYVGNAEDFGWVLPVPESPDISLGSDQIFTDLELNTRPQFLLERRGEGCVSDINRGGIAFATAESANVVIDDSADAGVVIEKTLSVGAFDAQVVSSDDPKALALWLADNNLDLTERGGELLAPYIQAKSKFVVLKLKSNAGVGSIQPIILKYQSDVPVIPMTLTAVAAQDDMGVLVWLLGDGRGVPKNFSHVTPNYTRLNWFGGTRSAYVSYQNLITDAMDEAGGKGFATDFAGYMPELSAQLTDSKKWTDLVSKFESSTDANFISAAWNELNTVVQSTIVTELPTSNAFTYQDPVSVLKVFTEEQLKLARSVVLAVIEEQVIKPLDSANDILGDDLYLTRLYTTLSAGDMDKNPEFTFNTAMNDQPLSRSATLTASCKDDQTHWVLKLGEGTGREDEVVVDAWEPIPFNAVAVDQRAMWMTETTSASADPVLLDDNKFTVLVLGAQPESIDTEATPKSSGGSTDSLFLLMLGLLFGFRVTVYSKNKRVLK